MTVCPFIQSGHPLERSMAPIRVALAAAPQEAPSAPAPRKVQRQHELKGGRDASGAWRIERFYASTLSWGGAAPFGAVTYHWSARTGAGAWFRFPADPYLGALDHLVRTEGAEVLQYVVLRRLTYRAGGAGGAPRIGKFKRRSRARGAFDVLARVSEAAARQRVSFRVPAALAHDDGRNLFHQEVLPGTPVSELVDATSLGALLHGVGRVHAELHDLEVPGAPEADERARLELLSRDVDWIALFRPSDRAALEAVRDALLGVAHGLAPAAPALCHGDLVCSHVLRAPDGWGVIDFDLAHRGDPHADAALLLASLAHDVPLLHRACRDADPAAGTLLDVAAAAYLEGYHRYGGRILDRRRLRWSRIAAEIHMLGLMFTKDRYDARGFERGLALVERLTAELTRAPGGRP